MAKDVNVIIILIAGLAKQIGYICVNKPAYYDI